MNRPFALGLYLAAEQAVAARAAGVPEDVLKQAREIHDTVRILWEWWTAENSDGFHNPTLARESLAGSLDASQDGVKLPDKAMADLQARK